MSEIASLFGIDRKTCHRWMENEGLRVIEKNVNPLLVMGEDLIAFIKNKKVKNKVALKEDEFFCMKCHKPTRAKVGSEMTVKTGKKIGIANMEQIKKTALCEICGTKLNRFLRICH